MDKVFTELIAKMLGAPVEQVEQALTEEVYAYLIGWVGECIDEYLNETNNE